MLMQLQALYREYDEQAAKVRAETKGAAGIWGMGSDPHQHHCHQTFYEAVAAWVAEFLSTQPDGPSVAESVRWILGAAKERKDRDSYWYTFAAQSHVAPMISWLSPEECREIADWYDTLYTRIERLPAQRKIYQKLRKAAKG